MTGVVARFAELTDELLDLTASSRGVRNAFYAVETDCSSSTCCCCCLCLFGCP